MRSLRRVLQFLSNLVALLLLLALVGGAGWGAWQIMPQPSRDADVRRERANDMELVGLLINTPRWAQSRPQDSVHSVPMGLNRPVDDPSNAWAAFVRRMAAEYRGRIDTWIIWNEPDLPPNG